ncbi:hypothetical protein [Priestia endophytica]|uniref:hypothetical protein n=1 Tax=Priestia endophytica TaxID=135735 RepID=UPI001A8C0B98|nr:hypothetical protein [Priestia endophytica]
MFQKWQLQRVFIWKTSLFTRGTFQQFLLLIVFFFSFYKEISREGALIYFYPLSDYFY